MTENEALKLNKQILDLVTAQPEGAKYAHTIDANIEFVTEPVMMFFLVEDGRATKSIKASNVKFNLKDVLLTGVPLVLAAQAPDSLRKLALICLSVISFIDRAATVTLSDNEANMVAYLHTHDGYLGLPEPFILKDFPAWQHRHTGEGISSSVIQRTLDNLEAIKTIEIVNEEVYLMEKVLFRV